MLVAALDFTGAIAVAIWIAVLGVIAVIQKVSDIAI